MRRAFSLTVAMTMLLATGLGCTKRVPFEEPTAEQRGPGKHTWHARQTTVITFEDGSQIKGKIGAIDERVELVTGGAIYRATVADLTDDEIVLQECKFIQQVGDYQAARDRLTNARVDLGFVPVDFVFQLDEITRVERVKIDPLKTASRAAFWAFTLAVSAFLLVEKS